MSKDIPANESASHSSLATLRRHDFVLSLIVWCICLATFVESWRLTFLLDLPGVEEDKTWLVSPGIFPLILSGSMLIMFSYIMYISLKEGEFVGHFSKNALIAFVINRDNILQIVQVSLLLLYVFAFVGRINFTIASTLYLFTSMYASRAGKWYLILPLSLVFSLAVTYLFGTLMKIPLP